MIVSVASPIGCPKSVHMHLSALLQTGEYQVETCPAGEIPLPKIAHRSGVRLAKLVFSRQPAVGVAVVGLRQKGPGQLSSSREELPVSEAIPRVYVVLGLRHGSLVGLCERMPSKPCSIE